ISEEAQRRAGTRVFTHVHNLSIRFHHGKRTGSVYRTIERGVRAIDFLLRFLAFNIAPTLIELALAAGVLAWKIWRRVRVDCRGHGRSLCVDDIRRDRVAPSLPA